MRNVNPNFYLALIFCFILFISGRQLAELPCDGKTKRIIILVLSILALPSLLFPLGYFDFFGWSPLYSAFRAVNRIEITTSLIAPLLGFTTHYRKRGRLNDDGLYPAPIAQLMKLRPFAFPFCLLFVAACFIKPIVLPIDNEHEFSDTWNSGVMMQSSSFTSAPAALATAMHAANGWTGPEEDIARGVFTCATGTENWYLARYATESGYKVKYSTQSNIMDVTAPSIAMVKTNGDSHFIVVLGTGRGSVDVGDPLLGRLSLSPEEFASQYEFAGFTMGIEKEENTAYEDIEEQKG